MFYFHNHNQLLCNSAIDVIFPTLFCRNNFTAFLFVPIIYCYSAPSFLFVFVSYQVLSVGVEDLWAAWEACPDDCMPLVLGDLNINFGEPRDERDMVIHDLIDDINLVDASRRYTPHQPCRQSTRARWTWRQKRVGEMHYLQPDYILARKWDCR